VIVTVTLNPALRVEYDADRVVAGEVNRVSQVRYRPGGRGLAVARHLQTFGHDVVAAGLAGGFAGAVIRSELAAAGVASQFTPIAGETRRVLMIADAGSGRVTSFAEPAPYITTEELGRLAVDYLALLDGATAVVLSGSLPDGMPEEIYGSLVSYAAAAGVPVVLDAGGVALGYAAPRGPALVIPDDGADSDDLRVAPLTSVVRPAGPGGVRVLTAAGEWAAELPRGGQDGASEGRASEGRASHGRASQDRADFRDGLVAGFVPGIAFGWSWPDALRHALALAASVLPSGDADLAAYERLLAEVEVSGPAMSATGGAS
jgi:tagatose 6-phosphate kinase